MGTITGMLVTVCLFVSFLLLQPPHGNRTLQTRKPCSHQQDLAPGIYFPHLKHFLFSAVIHFVSVTEPCLSSKTYRTAPADCVVSKKQGDESGM